MDKSLEVLQAEITRLGERVAALEGRLVTVCLPDRSPTLAEVAATVRTWPVIYQEG